MGKLKRSDGTAASQNLHSQDRSQMGVMKKTFKKISELLRRTPGKSCQDQLKKRIKFSPFKVADFTDSLEPVCNQCYTDTLIQVIHGDEKRLKTPHKHEDSRVGKRSEVFQLPFQ